MGVVTTSYYRHMWPRRAAFRVRAMTSAEYVSPETFKRVRRALGIEPPRCFDCRFFNSVSARYRNTIMPIGCAHPVLNGRNCWAGDARAERGHCGPNGLLFVQRD